MESRRNDDGFTLVELLVVLLILAILMAIEIPTYLGARTRADNKSAQATAMNALSTAQGVYNSHGSYATPAGASSFASYLQQQEPAIQWGAAASAPRQIGVVQSPGNHSIELAAWSPANGGTCWWVADVPRWPAPDAMSWFGVTGQGTYFATSFGTSCTPPYKTSNWHSSWPAST